MEEIQQDYELNTDEEKREYLKDVFSSLNMPDRIVDKLPMERVNVLIEAEEFNLAKNNEHANSMARDGESKDAVEGSLKKYILWARKPYNSTKYTYSLLVWFEWLSVPTWRFDDTISVDIGAGSIVDYSPGAIISYKKNGTEQYDVFNEESTEYKGVGTACVFLIDLPNGITSISNLELTAYYDVLSSSDELTVSGQYFHKILSCTTSIDIGDSLGISVSPIKRHKPYSIQIGVDPV